MCPEQIGNHLVRVAICLDCGEIKRGRKVHHSLCTCGGVIHWIIGNDSREGMRDIRNTVKGIRGTKIVHQTG